MRSPSVPWSASPPPDSDHDDFDLDLDSDVDWDSSSLSVPSPAPALRVKVETTDDLQPFKREPADIRDMLDAWEDFGCTLTSTVSSATVKLPMTDDLKFDALEFWEWEFEGGWSGTPEDQQDVPIVNISRTSMSSQDTSTNTSVSTRHLKSDPDLPINLQNTDTGALSSSTFSYGSEASSLNSTSFFFPQEFLSPVPQQCLASALHPSDSDYLSELRDVLLSKDAMNEGFRFVVV